MDLWVRSSKLYKPDVVVHCSRPSTWKVEVGGSRIEVTSLHVGRVRGQPGLHETFLKQNRRNMQISPHLGHFSCASLCISPASNSSWPSSLPACVYHPLLGSISSFVICIKVFLLWIDTMTKASLVRTVFNWGCLKIQNLCPLSSRQEHGGI